MHLNKRPLLAFLSILNRWQEGGKFLMGEQSLEDRKSPFLPAHSQLTNDLYLRHLTLTSDLCLSNECHVPTGDNWWWADVYTLCYAFVLLGKYYTVDVKIGIL